jgi:hypothetical protein
VLGRVGAEGARLFECQAIPIGAALTIATAKLGVNPAPLGPSLIQINAALSTRRIVLPAETRLHTLRQEHFMLTIPLERLAYIISKAREFDVEVPAVDEQSGSNPSDDAEWDVLEDSADNPAYEELVNAIDSLNESERIELLALTWLGRGDYSKGEWREALEEACRIHDEKETDYLTGTPLLADYLEEALSQLGS